MSVKRMRVYICDVCSKSAPEETHYCFGDMYKTAPDGWRRIAKMDLCPTCGDNFTKMVEGKKENAED